MLFLENVFFDCLTEAAISTIRRGKNQKRSAFAGKVAMKIAKRQNDPNYQRYLRYNKMRLELKRNLMNKYRNRGLVVARRTIR